MVRDTESSNFPFAEWWKQTSITWLYEELL